MLPLLLMGLITMPKPGSHEIKEKDGIVNVDALIKKVNLLNKKKKHQESLELLLTALDGQPEDSLLRPLLLQTFDMFLESEVRVGEQDIKRNKKNIGAYLRVASALELLDNNSRALEILTNGVCLNPAASDLWMKVAKLELKAQRPFEALDVFREVIRQDPKNGSAYNNAAFILVKSAQPRKNDLLEAEKYASIARKLEPKNPEYLDTLAEIEFSQGNPLQAQSLIKEAIKLAPTKDFFKVQLKRFSARDAAKPF